MKKLICSVLCVVMAISFIGCGKDKSDSKKENDKDKAVVSKEVNAREMLTTLFKTDEELGLKDKYKKFSDIDGSIDEELVDEWISANGEISYEFTDDGIITISTKDYGDSKANYTCLTIDGRKIMCVQEIDEDSEESDKEESAAEESENESSDEEAYIGYMSYKIDNHTLYMVSVEDTTDEESNSSYAQLIKIYRKGKDGKAEEALEKNTITVDSYEGTWTSDEGKFTIKDGKLTVGEDTYDVSINEKNELVVGKGDSASAYQMALILAKKYDSEDRTKVTTNIELSIYYTGEDENDKPNLASVLEGWNKEYSWETYYYSGDFILEE